MLNLYVSSAGLINALGSDTLDFFNRMSTNNLTSFPVNTYCKTVFTNDKGRIVDFVTLINLQDNTESKTLVLASPGLEDTLISHLDKFIIMDDVKLEKPGTEFHKLSVWGENVLDEINTALSYEIKNDGSVVIPENDLYAFYDEYRVPTVNFIGTKEQFEKLRSSLSDANELSDEDYELFRIKHGIPAPGNEINDNINPVECGLNDYISYNKGCYIGQEVISRLDAQGKIPKQMVLITSENGIAKDDKIFSNDEKEKKEVGFISSAAGESEDSVGLGFIRSVNLDFDKDYYAERDGKETKIKISKVT